MGLYAGGLGAQEHVGFAAHCSHVAGTVDHVEGVLHAARGMVCRGVERFEVIVVGFHFRAGFDHIAQADEDLGDLVGDAADQMAGAHLLAAARKGDIHRARLHAGFQLGAAQLGLLFLKRRLDHIAYRVHGLTHFGTLFFRHLAHGAQVAGQRTGLARYGNAHLLERCGILRSLDGGECFRLQGVQFINDCHLPSCLE